MYGVKKGREPLRKCRPHSLPCRINYNGQVLASRRYWSPTTTMNGKRVSYFRGRKLYGTTVKLPDGYSGFIISSTDQKLPSELQSSGEQDEGAEELEENEQPKDVGILEEQAEFDELIVWGHEAQPDESTDSCVRGVEEWISFAEKIHSHLSPDCDALKNLPRS